MNLALLFCISQIWHYALGATAPQQAVEHLTSVPVLPMAAQQVPSYAASTAGFAAAYSADPQQYYQAAAAMAAAPLMILGSPCMDNFTCAALPNSYCGNNHTCQCIANFIEDTVFTGTCRLAPGYNEFCLVGEIECRQPFVCNASRMCDCKPGFLQEYFQCVKDCPLGQVPVGDNCMQARQLEEKCEANEQCMQSYSQCLHNKCQCIPGTNQQNGQCHPVNQCPLGEPGKDKRGKVQMCNTADNEETCAKDFYCLHAEIASPSGFCCPKIKMNCPIGQALEGHNCTNCPWETHHCFSYVIGSYTETMCCPNACPSGHPIQKDGKCYAKSAYHGHCMVDEQCYNVLGATCRKDKDGKSRCLCPEGNFRNYYGRCLREAGLGEDCTSNEECRPGTNTLCSNGVCTCFNGYIPELIKGRANSASAAGVSPQKCIAEPSCPTSAGLKPMEAYTECTDDSKACKETEFCRRWWNDANHTYSLCCTKPKISDYEAMCKPFRMKLMAIPKKSEPQRCDITAVQQQYYVGHDTATNGSAPLLCPTGASCLFDPYSTDKGICCKPEEGAFGNSVVAGQHPAVLVQGTAAIATAGAAALVPPAAPPAIVAGVAPAPMASAPLLVAPVASNRSTSGSNPVAMLPNQPWTTGANVSVPISADNYSAQPEEGDDDEDRPVPIGKKFPGPAPATSASLATGARTPATLIQSNQSARAQTSAANYNPVVRIRGFNNNQQG